MAKRTAPEASGAMRWVSTRKRGARAFALTRSGRTLATLEWAKRWGSLALAEAGGHRWTFKREGFFVTRVSVREEGAAQNIAVFHPAFMGGGALHFEDGRTRRWRHASLFRSETAWLDERGKPLVVITPKGVFQRGATVSLESGKWNEEAALLATLGWYLCVLHADDEVAITSAAAAAAAAG